MRSWGHQKHYAGLYLSVDKLLPLRAGWCVELLLSSTKIVAKVSGGTRQFNREFEVGANVFFLFLPISNIIAASK